MSVESEAIKQSLARLGFDTSGVEPAPKGDPAVIFAGNQYQPPSDAELEKRVSHLKGESHGEK